MLAFGPQSVISTEGRSFLGSERFLTSVRNDSQGVTRDSFHCSGNDDSTDRIC